MNSIKKAALALVNLRRSDQVWILNNLESDERGEIEAEIKQLRRHKGIQALSFDEIMQLGKPDVVAPSILSSDHDRLVAWNQLQPEAFKRAFDSASDFTLWLIFKWDKLPDRTLAAKYLTDDRSRRLQHLDRQGRESASWLVELAVEWVLTEFGEWKPRR